MTALRGAVERGLNAIWYGNSVLSWCLLPLSLLVQFEVKRRRDKAPSKGATPDGVTVIVIGGLPVPSDPAHVGNVQLGFPPEKTLDFVN